MAEILGRSGLALRNFISYSSQSGDERLKILHLNEHLALKGGVEIYLLSTLPILSKQGIESIYVYGQGDPSLHSTSFSAPALGKAGFKSQSIARDQVQSILELEKPDLIHIHNVQNIGAVQAALAFAPTLVTTHDYRWICPANTFFYKRTREICHRTCSPGCFMTTLTKHCLTPRPGYASYFYFRSRWAIKHSEQFVQIISPSFGAQQRYLRSGFPEKKTTVLPYFCSLEPLDEPRPIPARPTITFLGRIAPNKGQEFFIQALGLLPDNVQGVMVGNITEDNLPTLQQMAEQYNCADRLTFSPWVSRKEILKTMDNTSVFVFPSLWEETLGIVGIEALSRGVPVVASEVGGV